MSIQRRPERIIILAALFTALAVVLGYLLAEVPNIELMTLSVFLAGVLLGPRIGSVVGVLSILFYSLFNPFGPPLPPLLAAQVAGFICIGVAGGLMSGACRIPGRGGVVASAIAGLAVTLFYDVLTTLATAVIALGTDGFAAGVRGVFAAGLAFMAIHTVTNTVVFTVAVVPIVRVVSVWEEGERS